MRTAMPSVAEANCGNGSSLDGIEKAMLEKNDYHTVCGSCGENVDVNDYVTIGRLFQRYIDSEKFALVSSQARANQRFYRREIERLVKEHS